MKNNKIKDSRRRFLKKSGTAALGTSMGMGIANSSYSMKNDTLKVGLIGCGGRGTGAANQALKADPNVVLTAMADIFEDRLETSLEYLKKDHGNKVQVNKKSMFLGFDAYQKVLDSDVDVVILTTPPSFRPLHLEKAVDAGKHIFSEKPMAVDAPGVRRAMAAAKKAKEKNLSLVSGFCWRYHSPKRETYGKILNGDIGDVRTVYSTYNTGGLWSKPWQPEWTDMERKMRNWLYYNWISGDHIVEQAIHSIDMGSWAMNDIQPKSVMATGGRQVRTEEIYGNIFDHFALVFDYENGARAFHYSRQQQNCSRAYGVEIWGEEGKCIIDVIRRQHEIQGKNPWRFRGEGNDMYQQEHDELFASIRKGIPMNDGEWMLQSTMMAIMGRMAAYTGQTITYEEAWNSEQQLGPDAENYSFDLVYEGPPVAMPGVTKFI